MTVRQRLLVVALVACVTCTSLLAISTSGLVRGVNLFAAGVSAAALIALWRSRGGF